MGLNKCRMTYIHHSSVTQNSFTAPKITGALSSHLSLPPTPDLFPTFMLLPFPKCYIVEIIYCISFSVQRLSLSNMHLRSSISFYGLIARFFLVLNNILLSGHTKVYLSIHLLKDILVVSKCWQL